MKVGDTVEYLSTGPNGQRFGGRAGIITGIIQGDDCCIQLVFEDTGTIYIAYPRNLRVVNAKCIVEVTVECEI